MARLHAAGVQSLFVEGGRRVAGALLEAGFADRIAAFIGFKVIGSGSRALSAVVAANPIASMGGAWALEDARVESGTDWILVEGRLAR
jgi:diaminohydroxyphosphoribosylaminopyrimidine deaminase/5-amino-6-(5-phosphoribosylamino)uracil reductase